MKEEKGNDLLGSGGPKVKNDKMTRERRGNCPFIPGWLGTWQVSWRATGSAKGCLLTVEHSGAHRPSCTHSLLGLFCPIGSLQQVSR